MLRIRFDVNNCLIIGFFNLEKAVKSFSITQKKSFAKAIPLKFNQETSTVSQQFVNYVIWFIIILYLRPGLICAWVNEQI